MWNEGLTVIDDLQKMLQKEVLECFFKVLSWFIWREKDGE